MDRINVSAREHPLDSGGFTVRTLTISSMLEWLWLSGLFLSVIFAVDPFEWRIERITGLRNFPGLILAIAGGLLIVGGSMRSKAWLTNGILCTMLPSVGLSTIVIAGSLYSRVALGNQNTFLTLGLYLLLVPITVSVLASVNAPERLVERMWVVIAIGAAVVLFQLAYHFGRPEPMHHELEFILAPVFYLTVLIAPGPSSRVLSILGLCAAAILFKKNTGVIVVVVVAITAAMFLLREKWSGLAPAAKGLVVWGGVVTGIVMPMLFVIARLLAEDFLPTGNARFRLFTYQRAVDKFLESPVWGTLFTGEATEKFTLFDTGVSNNILATHSDLLDIAAHGGIVAIILLLLMYARTISKGMNCDSKDIRGRMKLMKGCYRASVALSLAAVSVYAFNPILLQPGKATIIWVILGVALWFGVADDADPQEPVPRRP